MRSAARICAVETVQLVPSATTTTSGSERARRRAASTPKALAHLAAAARVDLESRTAQLVDGAEHHRVADGQRRRARAAQLCRLEVLHAAAGGLCAGRGSEHAAAARRA